MKKISLILSFAGNLLLTFSQIDCDYNPYQHLQEEREKDRQELMEERKSFDCEIVQKEIAIAISDYLNNKQSRSLELLSRVYCPEVNSFIKNALITEEDTTVRCSMISFLGSMPDETNASFLLDLSKNQNTTYKEKIAIASSLCAFEKYDIVIELLNSFCLDENGISDWECITAYEMAGAISVVLKFSNDLFDRMKAENNRARLFGAAWGLAQYGEYEKSYPIFLEELEIDTTPHGICSTLRALAMIGDEKAFKIIREHTQNENKYISNQAIFILDYIERARREKCKD